MAEQPHKKKSKRVGLSERERILRDRKGSGGLAGHRKTPEELELTEQLGRAKDDLLKAEEQLEAYQAAEEARETELQEMRQVTQEKERAIQSERDKLAHEQRVIEAERRDNVKFRGDAVRLQKEIEHTFKPGLETQAKLIEKEREKRREEVNKHLKTKAELERTKSKLKSATEENKKVLDASDPRNIDVSHMTKEEVEELRKKLTKHMRTLNGNGGKK